MLVAIGGLPGSGKSTLGQALAGRLGAALLDLDTLTNPLLALLAGTTGAGGDLDHPSLRGAVRDARYRCLADTAAQLVSAGCSAIAVAPFTAELAEAVAWQQFSGPGLDQATRRVLICVHVDPAVARQRRGNRGLPRDQSLRQRAAAVPTPAGVPRTPHIWADGTAEPQREAERLTVLLVDTADTAD
ncbi:MAG: ATP-binding protein [Actinomycetota bacterium]|nr:ATP-binding protein [Actinomycetota bacterium]